MKLSKQLFQFAYLIDSNITQCSTSYLINKGPFFHFSTPGIPLYLPIGNRIITAIENICLREAEKLEFNLIDMPQMIPSSVLNLGDEIGSGFLDQFIFLKNRMENFHLLSTPEPFFLDLLKNGLQSYRQLPFKVFFGAKFYRQLRQISGILKTREFKMLAGLLFCEPENSYREITTFNLLVDRIAQIFSLKFRYFRKTNSQYHEHFYLHPEGDETFDSQPAISMAMSYRYGNQKKIKTIYKNKNNNNQRAEFITFGMGLQRLFFAILDSTRDNLGFNLPHHIRPFDIAIIPSKDINIPKALELADTFDSAKRVLIDDRSNVSIKEKCRFSNFLGIPEKLIVKENSVVEEKRIKDETLTNLIF